MQEDLEIIFAQIDEYEDVMDKIEKIVENSEKDVAALEEYANLAGPGVIRSIKSLFKIPQLFTHK